MNRLRKFIISLQIDTGTFQEFVSEIIYLSKKGTSSYVCVANVHMIIEAYDDPDFARDVNNADLVTPDGMPLTKAIKLLHRQLQQRIAGMDLLPELLVKVEQEHLPVYIYGGTENMLANANKFLLENYPSILLAGSYSPPFRVLSEAEDLAIIDKINQSGARLIFVALGCPKQEKWMAAHKNKIMACMIGIGGALPVVIGEQKRAPYWMQKMSLEWFYRFIQEPKRLFKRYFYTNSKFLFLLLYHLLFKKNKLVNIDL